MRQDTFHIEISGGIALGANAQAVGSGGIIDNLRPTPEGPGKPVRIDDSDLATVLAQLGHLQAAASVARTLDAARSREALGELSREISRTQVVDRERAGQVLSLVERAVALTRPLADAVSVLADLFQLG